MLDYKGFSRIEPSRSSLSGGMKRYFFDVHDGGPQRDDTGTEFATLEDVRLAALRLIPDIAREEIVRGGDRQSFSVLVTDEDGRAVFTASLAFTGLWLTR